MNNLKDSVVSKYWDEGWKKRNSEIEDLINSSIDDLKKKAQESLNFHMKQKGTGSMFSNEINFGDILSNSILF